LQGEIQKFLCSYYQRDVQSEKCLHRWIGEFFNPLDSIDMISALMDNIENYNLTMYIHMENGYLHRITKENYNDVIKGLIELYYLPV
jgi:hypothetical protein